MRFYLLCMVLLTGVANASGVTVSTLEFKGKREGAMAGADAIQMPQVQTADQKVAANINDYLFIKHLGTLPPNKPGKVFTEIGGDADTIASQTFSVSRNDARVLTIVFENEGCGAYCEGYTETDSFDIRTGHVIGPDMVLTAPGMEALAKKVHHEKAARYRSMLVTLRSELKDLKKQAKTKKVDMSDTEERIALNVGCLGEDAHVDRTPRPAEAEPPFAYLATQFAEKELVLTAGRCSNHASRALDDVGDVVVVFPYQSIKQYMSNYGRAVLLGEGSAPPPDSVFNTALHGKIGGKMPITMLLNKASDNSIGGVYFYDKYRQPISLSGRMVGNDIELNEAAGAEGAPHALMRLKLVGGHLQGRWIGKTELAVELQP